MSSIWPLERLFDSPATIEMRERERQAVIKRTKERDGDPPVCECRVCGLRAAIPDYCPECLADTMVPVALPIDQTAAPGSEE